jgi:predicted anti-sigma-YlaC factor YlaD
MKLPSCSFEPSVQEAVCSDEWAPALREHVAGCASCQETVRIVQTMQRLAAQTAADAPPAPPYRAIWLRAEYAKRQRRWARLRVFQTLVPAGLTVVGACALMAWKGASLREALALAWSDVAASGSTLLTGGIPVAVLIGVVVITFALMEDVLSRDR